MKFVIGYLFGGLNMRTHCRNGHELSNEKDIRRKANGETECKICSRLRDKERYPGRRQDMIARVTQWAKDNPEKFKANQAKQELRPEVKVKRKKFYEETKSESWRKFSVLRSKAKAHNQDFEISQEDYERFTRNNACFYCSGPLPKVGYGIDRLNHLIGYVFANCVPCCETCNEKKGRLEGLGFQYPRTIQLMMELLGNN